MCFSAPHDKSGQIAAKTEADRQAAITQGRKAIDQNFSMFTPDFYAARGEAYTDFYAPQLNDQYTKAKKALSFSLARSGNDESSAGAQEFGDLTKAYESNRVDLANRALSAQQQAQADVASNKADLQTQLSASADPAAAAAQAVGRAQSLQVSPSYSPLGDLFGSIINQGAGYIDYARNGYTNPVSGLFGPGMLFGVKKNGSAYNVP